MTLPRGSQVVPFIVFMLLPKTGYSAPPAIAPPPATAPLVTQLKSVSLPSRQVRIVEEINFCFSIQSPLAKSTCFASAAADLDEGLDYQACLWQMNKTLTGCGPGQPPSDPAAAYRLLSDARNLAAKLRAENITQADVAALHDEAVDYVRVARGRYTLVSQGGVSLGSWQSGYVYFLTEVLKHRRDALQLNGTSAFTTLAGASAGAINAVAAGLAGCTNYSSVQTPEKSLFYRVWVDTLRLTGDEGEEEVGLLPRQEPESDSQCGSDPELDRLAVFSKAPLCTAMTLAEEEMAKSVPASCSFQYGLSVTHLKQVNVPVVTDGETVQVSSARQSDYFAFRVRPGASEEKHRVENLEPKTASKPLTIRLSGSPCSDTIDNGSFFNAVRASGAFPVAFPPVRLQFERKTGKNWRKDEAIFVDGGTLDNTPIGLAAKMNDWQRATGPNPWLADLLPLPDNYYLVDPNVISWERSTSKNSPAGKDRKQKELLGTYAKFAMDFFGSSSQAQLSNAARELEWLGANESGGKPLLEVPKRNLPIAGEQLGHFMAFLEEDFRVFDFYSGMWDAVVHLGDAARCKSSPGGGLERRCELIKSSEQVQADISKSSWQLSCLQEYHRVFAHKKPVKGGVISKDDLPVACDFGSDKPIEQRNFGAMLLAMHNYKVWEMTEFSEDAQFATFFDKLAQAKFEYRSAEMSDAARNGNTPEFVFRSEIAERAVERLSQRESSLFLKQLITSGGRVAADMAFTRTFAGVGFGLGYALNGIEAPLQVGMGKAGSSHAFRFAIRPRVYRIGMDSLSTSRRVLSTTTSLFLGFVSVHDLRPKDVPSLLDLEIWLGGSASLEHLWTTDGFAAQGRIGPSLGVSVVLLRKLYFGLDAEWSPNAWVWTKDEFINTTLGYESAPGKGRMNAALGWRFSH